MVGVLPYRGFCIWRGGDIDNHLAQEFAVSVKNLNSAISAIRDVNIVLRVDSDAVRGIELTGLFSWFTPLLQPIAVLIDFGNS